MPADRRYSQLNKRPQSRLSPDFQSQVARSKESTSDLRAETPISPKNSIKEFWFFSTYSLSLEKSTSSNIGMNPTSTVRHQLFVIGVGEGKPDSRSIITYPFGVLIKFPYAVGLFGFICQTGRPVEWEKFATSVRNCCDSSSRTTSSPMIS